MGPFFGVDFETRRSPCEENTAAIQRGFRMVKRDLKIAAASHRLPDRVRAHAMVCFLALLLHRVLRMRLQPGPLGMSVERVERPPEKPHSIQYHQVRVDGENLTGLSRMTPEQESLLDELEFARPAETRL